MDLTLRRPGFDFASTWGFWLCINPIHPHEGLITQVSFIAFAVRLVSFSIFFYMCLTWSLLASLHFFNQGFVPSPCTQLAFFGKCYFLWWVWTAQARLCVAWVMDLTLHRPGFDFALTPSLRCPSFLNHCFVSDRCHPHSMSMNLTSQLTKIPIVSYKFFILYAFADLPYSTSWSIWWKGRRNSHRLCLYNS